MNRESLGQIEANMRDVGRLERLVVKRPYFHLFISPQTLDLLTFATPLPGEPADWAEAVAAYGINLTQRHREYS